VNWERKHLTLTGMVLYSSKENEINHEFILKKSIGCE